MSIFDDVDWSGFGKSLVTSIPGAVAAYGGARTIGNANSQAANVAAANGAQNIALTQQAMQQARTTQAPALAHFTATMGADPSVLTPAQTVALNDTKRGFNNGNLIGKVGGRSYSKMYADTVGRQEAGDVAQNTARGDTAAGQVATIGANQGNIALSGTRNITGINDNIATNQGNAITGTARADADAYGQIANYFANSTKDSDKQSRYQDYKTQRV